MIVQKRASRAEEVEGALREQLGVLGDPAGRLPSETEIADRLGVSRVTVREALSSLARKGYVVRKHGSGTFVNHDVLQISTRLDESVEYGELIRTAGHEAGISLVKWHSGPISAENAERLRIAPGADVLTVHKVFTADGRPILYCVNVIPLHFVPPDHIASLLTYIDPSLPVYTLLFQWMGQSVAYQVAEVEARTVDDDAGLLQTLDCPAHTPLFYVDEIGYNDNQQPVFLGQTYYRPGVIRFSVVRKPGRP